MADDKSKRGRPDRIRINVHESYEKAYWKKELDVSGQQLAPPFVRSARWSRT